MTINWKETVILSGFGLVLLFVIFISGNASATTPVGDSYVELTNDVAKLDYVNIGDDITIWYNVTGQAPTTVTVNLTAYGGAVDQALADQGGGVWRLIWTITDPGVDGIEEGAPETLTVTATHDADTDVDTPNIKNDGTNMAVDTLRPTVSSVEVDTDPIYEGDLIQKVSITFSEAMKNTGADPTATFSSGTCGANSDGAWYNGKTL